MEKIELKFSFTSPSTVCYTVKNYKGEKSVALLTLQSSLQ